MPATISTHVLDTATGQPAAGVVVELVRDGATIASGDDRRRRQDRARSPPGLDAGVATIVFHPPSAFFRRVALDVELGEGHHHIPLLVSPYGCASYRGS